MTKKQPYPYTDLYESARVLGRAIAPDELTWITELPGEDAPQMPFILHLSCNAHYAPHIAYLAQKILERIGIECPIIGGPENCCGFFQKAFGAPDLYNKSKRIAVAHFARARPTTVLSVCPSCDEQFNTIIAEGKPFRSANVNEIFIEHLDALKSLMKPVEKKVVVHTHASNEHREKDGHDILTVLDAIPGIEVIATDHAFGYTTHCNPLFKMTQDEQRRMYVEAAASGAEIFVVPYHSCYRTYCGWQLAGAFEVRHFFELLAMSLDIPFAEPSKELRLLDDVDAAIEKLRPRIESQGYAAKDFRNMLEWALYPSDAIDPADLADEG